MQQGLLRLHLLKTRAYSCLRSTQLRRYGATVILRQPLSCSSIFCRDPEGVMRLVP